MLLWGWKKEELAIQRGNNEPIFNAHYLVYIGRQRDGPYKVGDCLYDVQDGEDPYPDPEKMNQQNERISARYMTLTTFELFQLSRRE